MDYLILKKYLLENFTGKRIEEKNIRKSLNIDGYEEFCMWINSLIDEAVIKPIKSSGPNGLIPTLYKRYQVLEIATNTQDYSVEIKRLHPVFNIEGYLNKSPKYITERETILKFDEFIRKNPLKLEEPASINERSFQIFGKEKFIRSNSICKSVLSYNTELENCLNMYHTPEPFFEQTVVDDFDSDEINVLIIENKDTWYTLKKIMKRNCSMLHGIRFDSLIYGEGKKITRKRDSLTEFSHTYYDDGMLKRYYYFGDLDMEGIEIFENVVRINPDLDIQLFKELYVDMLGEAENRKMPKCSELQKRTKGKVFFECFDEVQIVEINVLLAAGKYIPQEILNYSYYKRKVEKSN
ncbi:conserved protein of unknown function [Petrocella atlantisensis]|uniref:Wadjet protein JetD C-terminal domain-containing protein n=1 Tax=Petrocella atlantisensis TaxID=2173034 RepID=A0A3P7NVR7_9FIRM|nr:Wadjet anti-phage system protein JetD domain-containing protein [Petrocella atlantisensis]VDN47264.1 conserved protein of unknown function [Petrocella atlantisensis]